MEILNGLKFSCSVYTIVLQLYGWITNSLVCLTCFNTKLNRYPSFVLIGVNAFIDSLLLAIGNVDFYWYDFFGYPLLASTANGARIYMYCSFTFTIASSTIIIYMAVERIVTMRQKMWKKFNFISKKTGFGVLILIIFLLLFNTPVFFVKVNGNKNITFINEFVQDPLGDVYSKICIVSTVFLPIPLLTIANGYLIYLIMSKNKSTQMVRESSKKRISISITVAVLTLLFVILNLPYAITVLLADDLSLESKNFVYYRITICIGATFHAISFVSLYITNQEFRNSFRKYIRHDASVFPTAN